MRTLIVSPGAPPLDACSASVVGVGWSARWLCCPRHCDFSVLPRSVNGRSSVRRPVRRDVSAYLSRVMALKTRARLGAALYLQYCAERRSRYRVRPIAGHARVSGCAASPDHTSAAGAHIDTNWRQDRVAGPRCAPSRPRCAPSRGRCAPSRARCAPSRARCAPSTRRCARRSRPRCTR